MYKTRKNKCCVCVCVFSSPPAGTQTDPLASGPTLSSALRLTCYAAWVCLGPCKFSCMHI